MERCPKCGNKLSNIDVLCPRCGALVEVIQVKNSFIPPPVTQEKTPAGSERPNLVIYNEDFPGEESASAEESAAISYEEAMPEDTLPMHYPAAQPIEPFIPERLYETPLELKREMQAETRMSRRAHQKKRVGLEGPESSRQVSDDLLSRPSKNAGRHASPPSTEDQLLKEADELSSRSSWRARITGSSADTEATAAPIAPVIPVTLDDEALESSVPAETPVHRYRTEYRESMSPGRIKPEKEKSTERRKLPVPAAILLWVMVTAVLFLGFFYMNQHVISTYGSYGAFLNALTNGKVNLDASGDINAINVTVTETKTSMGAPSHSFSVTAPGASIVRFFPTGDVFDVTNGKATFEITDEAIALARGYRTYDSTVMADSISVDLTVGSSTVSFPIDPFEIRLISSEYEREEPQQAQSVASTKTITISLMVSPDAAVFINNDNYSDNLADDGRLSIEMPLDDSGETIFAVDVIQPGRQAVKDSFTVTQQAVQTPLTPEAVYMRTYTDTFECRGTTDPGATLSAQLNGKTFAGLVSDIGAYSVACTATEYGLYDVTLKASASGKADSSASISVERLPDADVFKTSAKILSASDIQKNTRFNVGVCLSSEIGSVTTDGLAQKFSIEAGSSPLACYYYGQTPKLAAGQKYTLYGMTDEAGGFYVMFVD